MILDNASLEKRHLRTLELDKVLSMLAGRTTLSDSAELALQLMPVTDISAAERLLMETDNAYTLIARFGAPSFGFAKNIKGSVARADAGAILTMRELLDIGETLRVIRSVYEWRKHCEGVAAKHLDDMFNGLIPNKYLEEKIFFCIKSEEEIDDNASPKLADLRRKIRSATLNVRERLEKMIKSTDHQKHLQDSIVTQRDGRFVVPVKIEYRSEIPGLVHDTSSSGATLFVEPMAVVEVNNELRVLKVKEKNEIERILAELSSEVASFASNIIVSYDCIVQLNLIFAKALLGFDMRASKPSLNNDGKIFLKNARHPLLDKKTVVPITVGLGDEYDTLIITGPNTGGKTVTIKTIGLLTLMTMCGMMIPVDDGSNICVFDNILADIGDEQSIEQSLSTFSAHMTNLVSILDLADSRSLVLVDELCAGTDPVEGAALATAILMRLREKGAIVAATTHYAELKSYALETAGVCNASCEFDVATLRPTYRLIIGLPGRSNAFAISERLGLNKEIVTLGQSLVSSDSSRFEHVVGVLEKARSEAEQELKKAAMLRAEQEQAHRSQSDRLQSISKEREKIIEKARSDAMNIVDKARAESNKLLYELEEIKKSSKENILASLQMAKSLQKSGIDSLQNIADPVIKKEKQQYILPRDLKIGDNVEIIDIEKKAVVLQLADKSGQVLVQAGIIKTRVPLANIRLLDVKDIAKINRPKTRNVSSNIDRAVRSATSEINMRGMNCDEAIMELDRYIDNSLIAGIGIITIIHGKGTGVLRKAVHEYLRHHQSVKSYRLGVYGEGESGVTIVELQ
ncbi:MAG: endonuclease MutS2 [Oscillospiraceae bacterium]|nr:endonuclease MutS2 [Oscillospiraceae bacterium]